ncbi:glycerol-3-phosphate acyltransferase 5 [Selaginella moellendorffii]|nr:glycerol-3-phosphate acyltransferase 5 [Selaginella moellendorffii]|eukprot:XP_002990013.2 glycerol-3-phosphate acyltransferase 5 [Selaginella moellendorffii]
MRSFRELVGLEDFVAVWFLLVQANSWARRWRKSMAATRGAAAPSPPPPKHHQHDAAAAPPTFADSIENCCLDGRDAASVVSDLHGTLLRSANSFPYFFLVAFEAGGGFPRALLLLVMYPLILAAEALVSTSLATRLSIFIAVCGARESAVATVAHAVLPKFFLEDMHPDAYRVFMACPRRIVVTATPRILAEPFLREFLGVERVVGPELEVTRGGICTGFVRGGDGTSEEQAFRDCFADQRPGIGLCSSDRAPESRFLPLCKEVYLVPSSKAVDPVPRTLYPKPLVFHDGRFAIRPTPLAALAIFLWLPFGFLLAIPRMLVAVLSPSVPLAGFLEALLGLQIRMRGSPPAAARIHGHGVLFVATHRMLVDPLFLSVCASRRVTAVTYSISRVSELLAPIKTMRLTRSRSQDARAIRALLAQGDLVMCPEGTTCREPYLLRFSSLFAELTDIIVPVAVAVRFQFFHGSTARGWKALDPLFFLLNPFPAYTIEFLDRVPDEWTVSSGKRTSIEVANFVQEKLARALGYECTNFTRRDKYRMLAGNDGIVKGERSTHEKIHAKVAGGRFLGLFQCRQGGKI